ncbi:MAG: hydroxymethylbilane synthase [Acidobacteriaceae bacterium]|nr:hydroxymethylbilane synthase [Acidobacteriaceae bacterium]
MPVLKIGSRGSDLALWQARHIAARLSSLGIETSIQVIKTTGDHLQTASLVQAGGKGLFTKEIEEALLNSTVDVAVHSLKDLPTENTPGLVIAAIPEREDPRDALLGAKLEDLAWGARVGTSSGRRVAQLRLLRPDLRIDPIRGNVDTRIRKLKEGQYDAITLAVAGLRRLGLDHEIAQIFTPLEMCPAPGQGALAVQTREQGDAAEICSRLNHEPTAEAVNCERAVLSALGGGCQLPVGVFAKPVDAETMDVLAVVVSHEGRSLRKHRQGPRRHAEELGRAVAESLLHEGAAELLTVP